MAKPRLTPPVITIGRVKRRMTGNATDGYRVRIDNLFTARVRYSWVTKRTIFAISCGENDAMYDSEEGCHEQSAANAIGAWFEARANGWGAPVVDRMAG